MTPSGRLRARLTHGTRQAAPAPIPLWRPLVWTEDLAASLKHRRLFPESQASAWTLWRRDRPLVTIYQRYRPTHREAQRVWERVRGWMR